MGQILDFLSKKKDDFNGNTDDLDKLIKKIEAFVHAPTTGKHTERMLPFAQNTELVAFVNRHLKAYFIGCQELEKDEYGQRDYDIIWFWYLVALLMYSDKVEHTIVFVLERLKATNNCNLSILRRIFHLCANTVYEKQLMEIEAYFYDSSRETTIYRWLNTLGVTPPVAYNWEFLFQLEAKSDTETYPLANNLSLTVKGFEPEGNGESFEIRLSDGEGHVRGRWNDFSNEDHFRFKDYKIQLKTVPTVVNLIELITELEEIYQFNFERNFGFSHFSRGFKKKENIQKWLLEK